MTRADHNLLVALLLMCSPVAAAAEAEPRPEPKGPAAHTSLAAAYEAARADGALILLVFGSAGCPACKALEKRTLAAAEFNNQVGALHLVRLDVQAGREIARDFEVHAIPDLVLMAAEGTVLARRQGFVTTAELLAWIEDARQRAASGLWEGAAAAEVLDQVGPLFSGAEPSAEQVRQLMEMLGGSDPLRRARTVEALIARREQAMPLLIGGLSHEYLGVRIGASEALRALAPAAPPFDPWATQADRVRSAEALQQWWQETGKLPAVAEPQAPDQDVVRSIQQALEDVVSDNALRRTSGMSRLVRVGPSALAKIREAIRQHEQIGNRRTVWVLEDVRWAILVPDAVESRVSAVRRALARGTSHERQDAATRLGNAGAAAMPALTELADDPDPLVKESALRALSKVGGEDALVAMAALLKAEDSNLRMTAAQALGHTKNENAAQHLLPVLADPDEIVACAAIAALVEIKAIAQREPLVKCLADKRWRVRAAAAEAIGKLKILDTHEPLRELLTDDDPFVVKNALAALKATGSTPSAAEVEALAKRQPTLTGLAVDLMLATNTLETSKAVTAMYDRSDGQARIAILSALRKKGASGGKDSHWKPLLAKAAGATDPAIRRATADVLLNRSLGLAAELLTPLLGDKEESVRVSAAAVVVHLVASRWGAEAQGDEIHVVGMGGPGGPEEKTDPATLKKQYAEWRKVLLGQRGENPDLRVALALYATGDGKSDVGLLMDVLDRPDLKRTMKRLSQRDTAISLILRKGPWPEIRPFLDKACQDPFMHASMLAQAGKASEPIRDHLLDTNRLVASLERAEADERASLIRLLLSHEGSSPATIPPATARNMALARKLYRSERAILRAVAVCAFGFHDDAESLAWIEEATKDRDPWIRGAALQSLIRRSAARGQLKTRLVTFLADSDARLALIAAAGLLEPEVRRAAHLERPLTHFRYDGLSTWPSYGSGSRTSRPPMVIPVEPGIVARVGERLPIHGKETGDEKDEDGDLGSALLLILAQYGDFRGVEQWFREWSQGKPADVPRTFLAGIALSRDPKYVPVLRTVATEGKRRGLWSVRSVLQWTRGMKGHEVRDLRREVNARMREIRATQPRDDW